MATTWDWDPANVAMCGTTNKDNKQRQQTKATDKGNSKDNTKDNTNGKQLKAANVATRKGQFRERQK